MGGGLNPFFSTDKYLFFFTGILITSTGIFNKNPTGTGILEKFLVGNGIVTPPFTTLTTNLGNMLIEKYSEIDNTETFLK